jgi:hypothetical protein
MDDHQQRSVHGGALLLGQQKQSPHADADA